MIKLHFRDDEYVSPPGSLVQILAHPYYNSTRSIELALFNDHRYAFFFWAKWTRKLLENKTNQTPPSLITFDWHQDLVPPTKSERTWLRRLNLSSNKDVSLYSWANLRTLNDTHVMAAIYLNLIGDVYVHCRQGTFSNAWKDRKYKDRYGNVHVVKKFKEYETLEECMLQSSETQVYYDIDLDFFTLQNPLNGEGRDFTFLTDKQIIEMLSVGRPLIQWVFQRLCGFTIATEPEHTGGLQHSNRLLDLINKIYFSPSLFANYGEQWKRSCNWKHLPAY